MNKIILIGFMGAGKTTFGKKLAKAMQLPFYDSDQLIEQEQNKTIETLFSESGESGFRLLEKELIQKFTEKQESFVLSVGGGLPCYHNLMKELNQLGMTVYLQHSVGALAHRLKNAKKIRPLLEGKVEPEFSEFIATKLAEREKYYLKAKVILSTNEQTIETLLSKLKPIDENLAETSFLNFSHPAFDSFLKNIDASKPSKELAVDLYYLVRDGFIYDPYHLNLTQEGLKASNVLSKKRAWCVEKSIVLCAAARKLGIPARMGFAVVKNHIGVEKLTRYLKREEIVFHGFVELFLNEKWVKCTPAFDERICAISKVEPLNWDGETDSLFQAYEKDQKFMEYLHFYGIFSDVPIELMNAEMKKYYPHLFESAFNEKEFSFLHL
jgi:shikimate kinase